MRYYLLCYDIRDPKRWREVHEIALSFGDPLQYSVFQCILTAENRVRLVSALRGAIKHDEDAVLLIDVGDSGRVEPQMTRLGAQPQFPGPGPTVL